MTVIRGPRLSDDYTRRRVTITLLVAAAAAAVEESVHGSIG